MLLGCKVSMRWEAMLAALEVHAPRVFFFFLFSFNFYLFTFSCTGALSLWGLLSSCSTGFSLQWFLLLWSVGSRSG